MTDWGNIALAVRMGGQAHPKFFEAWSFLVWMGLRRGDMVMSPAVRFPPHRAANNIVRSFLTEEPLQTCDTLLFVDDDHVFGYDTLEKMRTDERLREFDIVGALYAARGGPEKGNNFPVALRRQGIGDDGFPAYKVPSHLVKGTVVPCDALGLGFTMIRRPILEAVPEPWFEYREPTTTEDVVFCEKAIDAGARIAVDASTVIGHLNDLVIVPKMGRADERDTANTD